MKRFGLKVYAKRFIWNIFEALYRIEMNRSELDKKYNDYFTISDVQ